MSQIPKGLEIYYCGGEQKIRMIRKVYVWVYDLGIGGKWSSK